MGIGNTEKAIERIRKAVVEYDGNVRVGRIPDEDLPKGRAQATFLGEALERGEHRRGVGEDHAKMGALKLLAGYGLDRVLTEEDDPELWAAAVLEHWAPERIADRDYAALFFFVGPARALPGPSGRSGAERWVLEPAEGGGWRATNYEEWEGPPNPTLGMQSLRRWQEKRGGPVKAGPLPRLLLGIERPSRGLDEARVHSGDFSTAGVGSGRVTFWRKRPGAPGTGAWEETDRTFTGWRA